MPETVHHDGGAADGMERRRLRPIPNESIYLFVKSIDNSRVVRQAIRRRAGACQVHRQQFGVALLLVSLLLPHATD